MAVIEQETTYLPEGWTIEEPPQHVVALESGNQVRLRRAALRREIKRVAGKDPETRYATDCQVAKKLVGDMLLECPWWLEGMTLPAYLLMVPRWGQLRVTAYLARIRVSELRTVGNLTDRQRTLVAGSLADCGWGVAGRSW